jgi:hypothetical protein
MKTNIWLKQKKVTFYIGGDPEKNQPPTITLELDSPQITFDTDKYIVQITETK